MSLANNMNTQSTERLERPFLGSHDSSEAQYEIAMTKEGDLPMDESQRLSLSKQSHDSDLAESTSVAPHSPCETSHESSDVLTEMSPGSPPTSLDFGCPKLDQLPSDLEEMKFDLIQDTTNQSSSSSSSIADSVEADQSVKSKNVSVDHPEKCDTLKDHVSSVEQFNSDDQTHSGNTEPTYFQTSTEAEGGEGSGNISVRETSQPAVPLSFGGHEDSLVSPMKFNAEMTCAEALCENENRTLYSSFPEDMFQDGENIWNGDNTATTENQLAKLWEHQPDLSQEDCSSDVVPPEEHHSLSLRKELKDTAEDTLTRRNPEQYLLERSSADTHQSEDCSSQSLSDLTPETVTTARHFSFEDLIQYSSRNSTSSDEDQPKSSGQLSAEALIPVDRECFQSTSIRTRPELSSSTSDEDYSINSAAELSSTSAVNIHIPPRYSEVVNSGTDSPTFDYSDPEPFFDCKQAASDFSETEPEELEARVQLSRMKPINRFSHLRGPEHSDCKALLSSGSEDYEEATFDEPFLQVDGDQLVHPSGSEEEYVLCEASQPASDCEIGPFDESDKHLAMEINAEPGSKSESSDEEFLTTRIVRRRVVIQADEFADFPAQSVTEEKYTDENGHTVVKKVTRKVIRKCVSTSGVEHEETPSERAGVGTTEGAGYSKVVKRTVVKSVGDHTEVTFTEREGFSSTNQKALDGCKLNVSEKTTVVEGERTSTHQGDQSLASDLPSAQDDFKQALSYLNEFNGSELPPVVEKEAVREDGTVVRRAHLCKGRTRRRTVARTPGQHKQVLTKQVDSTRNGSALHDLQQNLHLLFHRYYNEGKEEDSDNDHEGAE